VAHVIERHRARDLTRSAGETSASRANALSRAGTTKRYGDADGGAAAATSRSVTGTHDVCITNVSTSPGASSVMPSDYSAPTVETRTPSTVTGSTRISRGPRALRP